MLKLLHTADWHLGLSFGQFDEEDQKKLTRARRQVIESILGKAEQEDVHAVLCAGDLFDVPEPPTEWWEELLKLFLQRRGWTRPVFLLPGNHDPLTPTSVWAPTHPFRQRLPKFVHVIDKDDFTFELAPGAVLHAVPCRSRSGQLDPTEKIPPRAPGDARIRIGMAHGTTFDLDGHQMNFPIAKDAAQRRGLDYLAIGDTHAFREVPEGAPVPTVYPGAPEQTRFGEKDAGHVAIVMIRRSGVRPVIRRERVAQWTWREETCRSLAELRRLASDDRLTRTVLRLHLDLSVTLPENEELEAILRELKGTAASHGRAGVLDVDRARHALDVSGGEFPDTLPELLRTAVTRLRAQAAANDDTSADARLALVHLFRLAKETS